MRLLLGAVVLVLPLLFNYFFARLAKIFEYPDILRRPTGEVLEKFAAGSTKLILTWWAFAATAIVFAPVSAWLAVESEGPAALVVVTVSLGVLAGLVQFLGLVRWPFLVPHLARENVGASESKKETIDLIFQSANRYLGVAVGEHLGYLFTGLWTISISSIFLFHTEGGLYFGIAGIVCGLVLTACSFEFVGKHERDGWKLAAIVTPFAYIAWSLWLACIGIWFILT